MSHFFSKKMLAAALISAATMPAHALVINSTFDANFNDEQKSVVYDSISFLQSLVTDNVTFTIDFAGATTGLGSSFQSMYSTSYSSVVSHLNADRTSANDFTAMSHVALGTSDATTGKTAIRFTYAQCFALGYNCGTQGTARNIGINLGLVDSNRSDGISAGKYDMRSVVLHEIDEFLGVGGPGSSIGSTSSSLGMEDLFRYTAAGARTWTTSGDNAYFSIDGGATQIARFNQNSGGDYADWWSGAGHIRSTQDAFGTPGVITNYGIAELTALDVLGWNLAPTSVPEPSSLFLMLPALFALRVSRRRKKH